MVRLASSLEKSVSVINRHIESKDLSLRCTIDDKKGRILQSSEEFAPGSIILDEESLYAVSVHEDNWLYRKVVEWTNEERFDYEPIWYWCALCSRLTVEDKDYISSLACNVPPDSSNYSFFQDVVRTLLQLPLPTLCNETVEKMAHFYAPVGAIPLEPASFLSTQMADILHLHERPAKLNGKTETSLWERIEGIFSEKGIDVSLQTWVHNCFDTSDNPVTYSFFFLSTFVSHSCQPNSVWTLDENGRFLLIARLKICVGDEITLSYLGDSDLYMPTWKRKHELRETKHFECTCERCELTCDLSRGIRCSTCGVGTCFLKADREPKQLEDTETIQEDIDLKRLKDSMDELIPYRCLSSLNEDRDERRTVLGPTLSQNWCSMSPEELAYRLSPERLLEHMYAIPCERCLRCHHELTEDEIEDALDFEARVTVAVEVGVAASKSAENWYRRVLCRLTQHWAVICFINDYASWTKNRSPSVAQRLLMKKVSLHKRICGFPTAQLGYSLMDVMEVTWICTAGSQGTKSLTVHTLQKLMLHDKIFPYAYRALFIFGLIFTYSNEYFCDCWETISLKLDFIKDQNHFCAVEDLYAKIEERFCAAREVIDNICGRSIPLNQRCS